MTATDDPHHGHPSATTADHDGEPCNPYQETLAYLAGEAPELYAAVRRAESIIGPRRASALSDLHDRLRVMASVVADALHTLQQPAPVTLGETR
jgi:hypothetical protein